MAQFPLIDQASLVMIPGAYKEGKIYSQLPTDGSGDFTYTRGTDTATRVNEAGNIDKGYENTLLQSNNWAQSDSQYEITGGEAGYDGTNDAWLVNKLAAAYFSKDALVLTGVMTISFYAKAGSLDRIFVFIGGDSARFDLTNGTAVSAGGNPVSQNIELVSGTTDWYRCSIVLNKTSTQNLLIKPQNSSNQDVTGTIYIQDAQLNQGLVAYPYLETTTVPVYAGLTDNMPRLDYTDATCPSLLLEPSRTNLYPYSEYSGVWSKTNWITTDNYAISPEGVQNAFRAVSSSTGGILRFGGTGTTGQDNTLSVWAKSNTGSDQKFRFFANGNTIESSDFTATNEWQRFEYTYDCTFFTAGIKGASSELSDILFYGFQHEAGSYPTSYIPTYGSTQTRGADVCVDAGDINTFNSTEGVLYFEGERLSLLGNKRTISISDGSVNNYLYIQFQGVSNTIRIFYKTIEFGQVLLLNHNLSNELGLNKYAFRWSNNNFSLWINGTKELEQLNGSTATSSVFSELNFALGNGLDKFYGDVKQVLVFDSALSDTECIALTTL